MAHLFRIALVVSILSFPLLIVGQSMLSANGKAIVNESGDTIILRGMGLGGWMLQEGYMLKTAAFANAQFQIREKIEELIGTTDTDAFYDAWLANHVTKTDIDSLASWGFNSVRLPMHYNLYTLPIEDEPVPGQHTWLDKGFAMTDSLINWCRANDMYVILDLHAAPGGQGQDQGISDYDTSKPSLWESQANRDKTVALWKKLAERYVNEPVVGAYDLINETNWPLENNQLLKDIYLDITAAIRQVDNNHIIMIEGNWFANDFTNLTPPWDNNLVYAPHKYWSINDTESIQWVINIRDQYDVPIYFGESGENSNTWFRDAIKLIEGEGMGWAWWPMKKIDDIAGPLSIKRSTEYQSLLDYWENGGAVPSAAFAKDALMQLTEDLKIENCRFQKDVIDAMFRQVYSDKAIPYNIQSIPGVVYSSDFDMGVNGAAFHDIDLATYHVSTGNYTAWNRGWSYRNDGVDIEVTSDNVNTNGYNIGFVGEDEWMQYSIDVNASALYDVTVRVASQVDGGKFHFSAGTADITGSIEVPNTGGWQTWQSVVIPNVLLTPEDDKLRFYVDEVEFNLGSFQFTQREASTTVNTDFLSGSTNDENTVHIFINKPLDQSVAASSSDFMVLVDGSPIAINSAMIDPDNPRIIQIVVDHTFTNREDIKVSYTGTQLLASDGGILQQFDRQPIQNKVTIVHLIPGKIEMEDYSFQQGIQTENTSDEGGGQNIGFLDTGDFLEYFIDVAESGSYNADFRTAALSETGAIRMQIIDDQGNASDVANVSFASTGDWQTWRTTSQEVFLNAGRHLLRVNITQPLFNMNWMDFSLMTSVQPSLVLEDYNLFPNPTTGGAVIKGTMESPQGITVEVSNILGERVRFYHMQNIKYLDHEVDLNNLTSGTYFVSIITEDGRQRTDKLIVLDQK